MNWNIPNTQHIGEQYLARVKPRTQQQVREEFPEAFERVPETYREDYEAVSWYMDNMEPSNLCLSTEYGEMVWDSVAGEWHQTDSLPTRIVKRNDGTEIHIYSDLPG